MRKRHTARLDDTTNLEKAYLSMYRATKPEPVEEQQDDESESDTMSAAAAIQQAAKQVEDEGDETSQELQKADQESEKYITKKIDQFKKS